MNIRFVFCGRYGEHFVYYHTEEDKYIVSCEEIDVYNLQIGKVQFDELFDKYYYKGNSDFDKRNKHKVYSRASNLGKELESNFWFFKHSIGTYEKLERAIRVYEILTDVEILELTDDEYLNNFIKCNDKVTEKYIRFMIDLKNQIKNERRK